MKSRIDSWHRKISTGCHFQNGHHNTAQIQHCPISTTFHMWVDNDVLTLKNFYRLQFSKWPPQYRKNSTLSDIIKIWYVGREWCPELIPDIEKFLPVAIFKMATTIPHKFNIIPISTPFHIWLDYEVLNWFLTSKNFYRSPFSKWHHNTAKIQHSSISKVAFNLFFKPVVSGRFGRLHNR
jgi:hypothetical protein